MIDFIIVVVVICFLAAVIGKGVLNLKKGKTSCGCSCDGCKNGCNVDNIK